MTFYLTNYLVLPLLINLNEKINRTLKVIEVKQMDFVFQVVDRLRVIMLS
jgi:hypothetical protein